MSDNYLRYNDTTFSICGKLVKGQVYETESYFEKNGTKYYSLYRYNSKGERGWYGYVNENVLKNLSITKMKKDL